MVGIKAIAKRLMPALLQPKSVLSKVTGHQNFDRDKEADMAVVETVTTGMKINVDSGTGHGDTGLIQTGFARGLWWVLVCFLVVALAPAALDAKTNLTILHTNDLHSHLLGFSPNIDFTPDRVGDDKTVGGWARLATVIKKTRKDRDNPVLVIDAGDFLMGSLFHLQSRQEAFELRLLKEMGYDMVGLGNHEFDLMPDGLARILTAAQRYGQLPAIVLSNAIFDAKSPKDDGLEKLFAKGLVKPYRVLKRAGLKIGFFGLMGKGAAEVAPFSKPVTFSDPIPAAKKMINILREKEKVDLVICLSHSGLYEDKDKSEDEILAKEVKGIDVIISGHTHTKLNAPIKIGETLIVSAGEYGKQIGVMDLSVDSGAVSLENYALLAIDDHIKADENISRKIDSFSAIINERVLAKKGLAVTQVIAHTDFDLTIKESESNLGNLIADSIRWYVNKHDFDPHDPVSEVVLGMISNGVIRDNILKGKTGNIAFCDAFRAIPLGIGMDGSMAYPLVSFYLRASELKKAFEILTTIHPMKGPDYFLQFSGAKIIYNPNRILFDRVVSVALGDEARGYVPLDYGASNKKLYRVAADIYNSTFLKVIGSFTWGILEIVPKDRDGNPIADLKKVRVDRDKNSAGIQELKEWMGVMAYIKQFADTDKDGIPDVPAMYKGPTGRNVAAKSLNPYNLLKGGSYVTWIAFGAISLVLLLAAGVVWFVVRRFVRSGK
jgi:5'-nucleotidase / UDP-sugar diphosphatase